MGACSRISLWEYRANCATRGCLDPAALAEPTCVVRPWSSIASPARPVIHTTSPTLGSPSRIARCPPPRTGSVKRYERAVDLLGVLKEVSVVRQVRPRPVGRASAHGAADIPEQHDEERHEPTAPACRIPIEVTVARGCPLRARIARQDHPRHRNLRRPRLPRRVGGSQSASTDLLHDGLQARDIVQVGTELRPTTLGCVPPGRPSAGVVQVHAARASGAHLILPPIKHIRRYQSRNRKHSLCFELVQLRR